VTTEHDRATVDGLLELVREYGRSKESAASHLAHFEAYHARRAELQAAEELAAIRSYAERLAQVQQVPDEPDNQWIGDVMILTVLMQSDCVNEQEREVLARWIAAPASPGEAAQTTQGEPQ
jgi:hypothetical protein